MSDTLLRQWEMLRSIPRAPRKIDASTLMARLEAAGYRIDKRTVQRDLNDLSRVFPLQSDTRNTPYGWSWSPDAPTFDLPAMDGPTALTVRMIEQFIPTLLPPSVRELLAPQFARAGGGVLFMLKVPVSLRHRSKYHAVLLSCHRQGLPSRRRDRCQRRCGGPQARYASPWKNPRRESQSEADPDTPAASVAGSGRGGSVTVLFFLGKIQRRTAITEKSYRQLLHQK
jgi:hypothetical protein